MKSKQAPAHFRSLTGTISVAFLALSLFILLLSTSLEFFFSFQTQQKVVENQQLLIAQSAASTVGSFIQEKFRILDQAADLNDLATDSTRRELIMSKLLGRDAAFRQLFLLDTQGNKLYNVSRLAVNQTPTILDAFLKPMLSDVSQGKQYISPIYIDPSTNEPLILVAVPARNTFRDVDGVFIAEVNLKFMWDLVNSIQVGARGVVYVVDNKGDLIAYKDTSLVLRHTNVSTIPIVHGFVAGDKTTTDDFSPFSRGIAGTWVVASHQDLGTPDWSVVVELPIFEAYKALLQEFFYSLLVIIFGAVLAVVSGIYFSRRITKGLINLSDAADMVSRGTFDITIPAALENNENEIGHLATSFNIMTAKLRELYAAMDTKVKEKTTELSSQVEEVQRSKSAILNLLEDIDAEKKKAEAMVVERTRELRDEKARLLASINSLSFGFVLADIDHKIILKNPALMKILEIQGDPITIHDISKSFDSMGVNTLKFDLAASCKECIDLKRTLEIKEVPYGQKYLRVFCAPISSEGLATDKHEAQDIIGYVFIVEDITEAKVMERSREEFFAVASHELRTPLTAIRGNADMILDMYADKIVDQDMKEMLTDIDSSSIRLIDIVNDFLEVSRLEQGRIVISKEDFDILEVVAKVERNLKEMIAKKGIALVYTPPTTLLPHVFSDKNRVEQILINLIGNSTKFTKEGSITIVLSQLNNFIKVQVTDTGIGISESNQALLFRKFQQAGEQVLARDVTQGTGLGLYICRQLIGQMGGTIGLEKSELGKGSVFAFTVPIVA